MPKDNLHTLLAKAHPDDDASLDALAFELSRAGYGQYRHAGSPLVLARQLIANHDWTALTTLATREFGALTAITLHLRTQLEYWCRTLPPCNTQVLDNHHPEVVESDCFLPDGWSIRLHNAYTASNFYASNAPVHQHRLNLFAYRITLPDGTHIEHDSAFLALLGDWRNDATLLLWLDAISPHTLTSLQRAEALHQLLYPNRSTHFWFVWNMLAQLEAQHPELANAPPHTLDAHTSQHHGFDIIELRAHNLFYNNHTHLHTRYEDLLAELEAVDEIPF